MKILLVTSVISSSLTLSRTAILNDVVDFFDETPPYTACNECVENTFCANETQVACPANSSGPRGAIVECLCGARFRRESLVCVLCPASEVCVAGGGASQACAAGASNVNQLCKCAAGTSCSLDGAASCLDDNVCLACPAGSYCANNQQTGCKTGSHSPANSSSATACLCVAGNFLTGAGACEACPVGSYCTDEGQTPCSLHDAQLTTATTGAASKDECVCVAAHAFYSPGGHANSRRQACLACPANKNTTQATSTAQRDCLCVACHGDLANNANPSAACALCVSS